MRLAAAIALSLIAAAPALARDAAPSPTKPVALSFFSGRWYEIARTDNDRQKGCEAPTYEFSPRRTAEAVGFTLTCRKGSPGGRAESLAVTIRLPGDAMKNRFKVSALGGVLRQEYWVLDRADDYSWAIMATPGGDHVWLLARKPNLDAGLKAQLIARIRQLGYDTARIVQPRHA